MSKPTWDDTTELDETPSWDDTVELNEPSQLEAAVRGVGQGVTAGFLDELMSMIGTKGASPSQVVSEPNKAVEIERQMMKDYDANLDEERSKNKAASDAHPYTYGASDIAGGVLPGLLSGGGTAAGSIAKAVTQGGLKQAMKQGGKTGLKYGAVSGAGYSDADDLKGLALDTAIGSGVGSIAGATLPVLAKGGKEALKKTGKKVKGIVENFTPASESMKAGYAYGKQGKHVDQELIDIDLKKLSKELLDNIKADKEANNLTAVKQTLDDLGIKVDTKAAFDDAIEDLEKIARNDIMDLSNKDILPKLRKLRGDDLDAEKMAAKAETNAIKKVLESEGNVDAAVIKGEKRLAKKAMESGDSLETITDINNPMSNLELPLDTSGGTIAGAKGKFKTPEGEEYVKNILSDATKFQPVISQTTGPLGRPIVQTKDLGSGKFSVMVGQIQDKLQKDLGNMTISEVESIRKQLNVISKMAKVQGAGDDEAIGVVRKLTTQLKGLTDEAVEKTGNTDLIDKRARFSDIFGAEELIGVNKRLMPRGDIDSSLKVNKVAKKFGFEGGFSSREERKLAENLLGDNVISPDMKKQFDLMRKLNLVAGKGESGESFSPSAMYRKYATELPNVLGRAVNQAEKLASPVTKTTKKLTEMSTEGLTKLGNKLSQSSNLGVQGFGNRLTTAMAQEGTAKNQAIWALSQSPAFRSLVKRMGPEMEEDVTQGLGIAANAMVGREPSSVDLESGVMSLDENVDTKQREGKASDIKKYSTYTGLKGIPNTRVEGSESDYGLYYDSMGKLTGGIGDLISSEEEAKQKMNMTEEQAHLDFQKNKSENSNNMINDLESSGVEYKTLPDSVKEAINNAAFQLGSFSEFPSLKKALANGNFNEAAIQAMTSNGIGSSGSGWIKQTPQRVRDFVEAMNPSQDIKNMFNEINTDDRFDFKDPESNNLTPQEVKQKIEQLDRSLDTSAQMQSSGDTTPVESMEESMSIVNELVQDEDQAQEINDKIAKADTYQMSEELKEMVRKIVGRTEDM